MGRSKNEFTIHHELHVEALEDMKRACNEEELNTKMLMSIWAFCSHMDLCLSRLIDLEERRDRKNAADA